MAKSSALIGVVENANTALLVTVASSGALLDRRTITLTQGLSTHPHHHEGSWAVGRYLKTPGARAITLSDAVRLVDQVRKAALAGARAALDQLSASLEVPPAAIALRESPAMPATTEARIRDTRAQTYADSAMYREVLAEAAVERGWTVHRYDPKALQVDAASITAMGKKAGSPWTARHRLAAAAALELVSTQRPRR